jgi:hypothetical protein
MQEGIILIGSDSSRFSRGTISYLVQTADIAAGFASKLLEVGGLLRVATIFEYVTYNGARLTQADAERLHKKHAG